jgi:hypothetical protein
VSGGDDAGLPVNNEQRHAVGDLNRDGQQWSVCDQNIAFGQVLRRGARDYDIPSMNLAQPCYSWSRLDGIRHLRPTIVVGLPATSRTECPRASGKEVPRVRLEVAADKRRTRGRLDPPERCHGRRQYHFL